MLQPKALAVLLRRERSDLYGAALLVLLIAFTVFVCCAGLRLLERASDDGLKRVVGSAPAVQRTIQFAATRSTLERSEGEIVFDWLDQRGQVRARFPESLQPLVGEESRAVSSLRLRVNNPPEFPIYLNLRYQDDFPALADVVEGRWPQSTSESLPAVAEYQFNPGSSLGFLRGVTHSTDHMRRFEIALQDTTAQALGLGVGALIEVDVDLIDTMFTRSAIGRADVDLAPTEFEVTGLYHVRDPAAEGWFGDPALRIDDVGNTGTTLEPIAYITGYVAQEALPGLVRSGLPFEYRWRFQIIADNLDAAAVSDLERGLRSLPALIGELPGIDNVTIEAGLLPLIERHVAVRSASVAALGIAAGGPLALALGAIAMTAVLLARRRHGAILVARGRGAVGWLLAVTIVTEALVVAAAGSLIGVGLAMLIEPAAEAQPSLLVALALGAVAALILVAAALPALRRPLGDLGRGARPARGVSPRRLIAEITLIGMAIVGAYVLRQRGVGAGASAGGVTFDPLLAAVAPLIGLATGLAAMRLYLPLMAVAGYLAGRRRDLVPVLGARTIARGAVSAMPTLVLILSIAFATFTAIVWTTVDGAQLSAGSSLRDDPLMRAVGIGYGLAFGVSVAYGVLTILGDVLLAGARRTRDVAVLRTLGLRGRQATQLALIEHLPAIAVAVLPGIGLGVAVALVIAPALDLRGLSGSDQPVALVIDWLVLIALTIGLAVLAVLAVVAGSLLSRRVGIINALRIAEE